MVRMATEEGDELPAGPETQEKTFGILIANHFPFKRRKLQKKTTPADWAGVGPGGKPWRSSVAKYTDKSVVGEFEQSRFHRGALDFGVSP